MTKLVEKITWTILDGDNPSTWPCPSSDKQLYLVRPGKDYNQIVVAHFRPSLALFQQPHSTLCFGGALWAEFHTVEELRNKEKCDTEEQP